MSESTQTSAAKGPRKWRRRLKWCGIAVAALAVLGFLAYSVFILKASRAVRREVEAIKAANEPLNWQEMQRTDLQGRVQPIEKPIAGGLAGPGRSSLEFYAEALPKCRGWSKRKGNAEAQKWLAAEGAFTKEGLAACGAALGEYRDALELFRSAPKDGAIGVFPGAKGTAGQDEFDQFSLMRESARLLWTQALYAAAQGKGDEAADGCIALCRFVRAYPGDNAIGGLVHIAIENVVCLAIDRMQNTAPSSAEKLSQLMAAVSDLDNETPLARITCGERVYGSGIWQTQPIFQKMPRFFQRPNFADYLKLMRETVAASRKPFPEASKEMDRIVAGYATRSGFYAPQRLLVPALKSGFDIAALSQAEIRVTLASLALRRARLADGEFPKNLSALVPKHVESVPLDPFTGEPVHYRLDPAECVVYSVGIDGVDDGGRGTLRTGRDTGTDIAVHIPR